LNKDTTASSKFLSCSSKGIIILIFSKVHRVKTLSRVFFNNKHAGLEGEFWDKDILFHIFKSSVLKKQNDHVVHGACNLVVMSDGFAYNYTP
jgi:hypothetical protein